MRYISLMLLGLTAFTSLEANATDWKNYPAAACVKSSGSGTVAISSGRIYNSSTSSSVTVTCPITRDQLSTGLDAGSEVWFVDQSSTANIECSLCARDMTDTLSSSCTSDSSSGYSSTPDVLLLNGSTLPAGSDYFYYLTCTIPAKGISYSYLNAYEIEEEE